MLASAVLGGLPGTTAPAAASACALYPIALSTPSLTGMMPGESVSTSGGSYPGSFVWLTWAGTPSAQTLVASLTPPGNSDTYVNPFDPSDHTVTIGDWVRGSTGLTNSSSVRKALDYLIAHQIDMTVPVWDEAMPLRA